MNEKMRAFRERIKYICKRKEKSEELKEEKYDLYDLGIVEDTIDGNVFVCIKESLGKDGYGVIIGANNIEDGKQVAEYKLLPLPGGRSHFGGYTDKEYNVGKKIYSFIDVWYKIYGKELKSSRTFTKSELVEISQEIKEKFKNSKYRYIYSIKRKEDDIKYLLQYLNRENSEVKLFEMIDNQYILTDSYIMDINIPEFKLEEIKSIGKSRIYSRARFAKEACMQIIEDYERTMKQEER